MTDREATRARIRSALCDEVPVYGRTFEGTKRAGGLGPLLDLEEYAELITAVVMKARGEEVAA